MPPIARRAMALALAVLSLAAIGPIAAPEQAHAGSVNLYACNNTGGRAAVNNLYVNFSSADMIGYADCNNGGLVTRGADNQNTKPAFASAQLVFNPREGVASRFYSMATQLGTPWGGWRVGMIDHNNNWVQEANGYRENAYTEIPMNATSARLISICAQGGGCNSNGSSSASGLSNNRHHLTTTQVTESDLPDFSGLNGTMWGTNGWITGDQAVSFSGSDGHGVQTARTLWDGNVIGGEVSQGCDHNYPKPCPDVAASSTFRSFSTGASGAHTLTADMWDAAGNYNAASKTVYVDNTNPTITRPTLDGSSAWRPTNSFALDWEAGDEHSGLNRVEYRLCRAGTETDCASGNVNASGQTIGVPGAGEWDLRLNSVDNVGRQTGWSDRSAVLRYDPHVPGSPATAGPEGWTNETAPEVTFTAPSRRGEGNPSGIPGFRFTADNSEPDASDAAASCPGACAEGAKVSKAVTGLDEGVHTIKGRTITGAQTLSSTAPATVRVDRTDPEVTVSGAPQGATNVDAGSPWQPSAPALGVTTSDALSGMTPWAPNRDDLARVQIKVDGVVEEVVRGGSALFTPPEGDHLIEISAFDNAQNESTVQRLRIRVDSERPGATRLNGTGDGWLNRATAGAYRETLALEQGAARGPSGLRGYATTFDGSQPGDQPTVGATGELEWATPPEGIHTVRARAISGAGRPSTDVSSAFVRVDRGLPTLRVAGAPGDPTAYQPEAVTLRASATDAVSGMEGGFIETRVDGGPVRRETGNSTEVTVAGDGAHEVWIRALDAAGNPSGERTVAFRVDRSAPKGGFLPINPNDPQTLIVETGEQCLRSASVEIKPAGGDWQGVPTKIDNGRVIATIDDSEQPKGEYLVRARVVDCAGNAAILDRWGSGAKAGETLALKLPLRAGTLLYASVGKVRTTAASASCKTIREKVRVKRNGKWQTVTRKRQVCTCPPSKKRQSSKTCPVRQTGSQIDARVYRRGQRPEVATQLVDAQGRPMAGRTVTVQTRPATTPATGWQDAGTGVTQANGTVTKTLPAGPSRQVRFTFAGTDTMAASTSRELLVATRAAASIKAARTKIRNKQTARLSGRLLGGYVPPTGRRLELQVWTKPPGKKAGFYTVPLDKPIRTTKTGAFKAAYKFTRTFRARTYRFRISVPAQADHPFAAGVSREVKIRVRP